MIVTLTRDESLRRLRPGTSLIAATIADDDRFIALVMIVAMIVIPRLARRFVPALGPDAH